ncbi:helix-turn-helix domain-containing protein [Mesorhizobium sp. M0317]|uniref:helix-turn-helix domain-containing protein n=1 Tax=Mesorhizobium sp. M0317 TaxID=2956935 RepID=UPI003334E6BF
MPKRSKLNDEQKAQVADLREAGMSYDAIGRRMDLSRGAISWYCLLDGIDSPKTARRVLPPLKYQSYVRNGSTVLAFSADEDAQLLALAAEGTSHTEIGKIMRRKPNSVSGRLATLARHDARREAAE